MAWHGRPQETNVGTTDFTQFTPFEYTNAFETSIVCCFLGFAGLCFTGSISVPGLEQTSQAAFPGPENWQMKKSSPSLPLPFLMDIAGLLCRFDISVLQVDIGILTVIVLFQMHIFSMQSTRISLAVSSLRYFYLEVLSGLFQLLYCRHPIILNNIYSFYYYLIL